jgi:uncharacterized protein (TIRG00374 family)
MPDPISQNKGSPDDAVALELELELATDSGKQYAFFWRWETFVSLAIAAALLTILATQIDFDQLWRDLAECNQALVLLGFLAHYATYPVRGLRWKRTLGTLTEGTSTAKFGMIVFFYNALDNVLPAKLGDLYAAHLARLNFRIRRSSALGSIIFLRLIDAWTVFLLAGVSSWFVFSAHLPKGVALVLGVGLLLALIVSVVLASIILLKNSTPDWVPERAREMIDAFHGTMWPARKDRLPIAGLTVTIWFLESLWIYCLVSAFGIQLSLAELVFLTQLPLLASAFPLTPSGAGAVEITLYSCLKLVSISHPLAISITVLNRLIDFWLHIALGILMWMFRGPLGLHTLREKVPLDANPG